MTKNISFILKTANIQRAFNIMKLIAIFLVIGMSISYAGNSYSQITTISLNLKNKAVSEVLKEIEKNSEYIFLYNQKTLDIKRVVSIESNNETISTILDKLFKGTDNIYRVSDRQVYISKSEEKHWTEVTESKQIPNRIILSGTVVDDQGETLPGVNIYLKSENAIGTVTDVDGKFSIAVPNKNDVLVFTFIGMQNQEIKVSAGMDRTMKVVMKVHDTELDDIVITGYYQRKKESYTGATTTVTGDELRSVSTGNLLNTLSSIDPSFSLIVNNEMGSDPNHVPEFTLRGQRSLKSEYEGNPNSPTFIMDGFEVSAEKVFDLDPNRVSSITILKDAAATAIYGSRAANGVVVITTKIPEMGELRVSYSGSLNLDVADLSNFNLMNSKEKFQFEQNSGIYDVDGQRPDFDEEKLQSFNNIQKLVSKGIDTDWTAIPLRNVGVGQRHTLSFEGGDQKFRYSYNLDYTNNVGVMKGSGRTGKGIGIRLQYNHKKFRFMNYLTYNNVKTVNSPYGNFAQYSYLNPYYYPYNEDGTISKVLYSYRYYDQGFTSKTMYNGLYNTTIPSKNESKYNDFTNNFSVEYDIIEGLKLKSQISITNKQSVGDVYLSKENISFISTDYKGSYTQSRTDYFSYDFNSVLSYTKLMNKHLINGAVVVNFSENKTDAAATMAVNYPNAFLDHIGMGTKYMDGSRPSGSYNITRLGGFVGNLNYSYDNRFLFDASVRSDASSLFGSNNRWGTFGSVGLGWNIHNEGFMKDNGLFEILKLRGSWGLTGGQNFYAYQSLSMLSYTDPSINGKSYDANIGAVLKAFGNKNLKWQRIEKNNIGLDFETKNRRITGYVNYYSDLSKDVLIDVSLAPSLGFDSFKENLGEVKNSGIELSIRGSIVKNRDLQWDVFTNVVRNENKLMKINKALDVFNQNQDAGASNKPKIRYMQGKSINTIWANESLGIDPVTGREIFLDMEGNVTNIWSSANYKPLGNTDPDFYGNFGTRLLYKGIELNALFSYSYGGDIYNSTLVDKIENIDPNENGDKRILTDRWQKPGDIAKFIGYDPYSPTFTRPTSRFIERDNYIEMRSLSLAYQFGQDLLQQIGLQRVKVSLIGNNIFRLSTVEMERGISYPFARTYSFALQVTF